MSPLILLALLLSNLIFGGKHLLQIHKKILYHFTPITHNPLTTQILFTEDTDMCGSVFSLLDIEKDLGWGYRNLWTLGSGFFLLFSIIGLGLKIYFLICMMNLSQRLMTSADTYWVQIITYLSQLSLYLDYTDEGTNHFNKTALSHTQTLT